MNILVGCEESQVVATAFRMRGHNAYSCDLKSCSGGHPEYHIQGDVLYAIDLFNWDMAILHPPCTYTALCGNRWYHDSPMRKQGVDFCKTIWDTACEKIERVALEQPKTIMQRYIGQRSQVIHPWQFGHGETKETWLWLQNLPHLIPTNIVAGREGRIWRMPPSQRRSELRSKTYPGIGDAMAEQWGKV